MKTKTITTDIYLASALIAMGAKMDSVDKSDPRHMKFCIVPNDVKFVSENLATAVVPVGTYMPLDLEYYEREWANGTLVINAVAYKNAIQQMKSIIHST